MKKTVWYIIERRIGNGEWVDEGYSFDTLEDAQEELEFLKGYPEKFRIVELHGTIIWEAGDLK